MQAWGMKVLGVSKKHYTHYLEEFHSAVKFLASNAGMRLRVQLFVEESPAPDLTRRAHAALGYPAKFDVAELVVHRLRRAAGLRVKCLRRVSPVHPTYV